jgi:hypothetical protein
MIEFHQLTAEHAMSLGPLESIHKGFAMTAEMAVALEDIGGRAAVDESGRVVAIGGIIPRWEGVGMAWVWLTREWRKHARAITDEVAKGLAEASFHRVELGVKIGYDRGEAWAHRLGFVLETPVARKWGPDGGDYSLWVRLKDV